MLMKTWFYLKTNQGQSSRRQQISDSFPSQAAHTGEIHYLYRLFTEWVSALLIKSPNSHRAPSLLWLLSQPAV